MGKLLQNSIIDGFVVNFYSVYSGILTTGEFTGDAIQCKLQLYFALCQPVV